jgi:hypothetical protein
MLPWLAAFARRCNARDHAAGCGRSRSSGGRVFALVDAMRADGVAMELHKQGLLVAAREPGAARRFLAGLEPMRELGYDVPDGILEGRALRDAEPALGEDARAGLRIGEHWHVLPGSLVGGLGAWLRAAGAEILEGAEVVDLETDGDAISTVRTAAGDVGVSTRWCSPRAPGARGWPGSPACGSPCRRQGATGRLRAAERSSPAPRAPARRSRTSAYSRSASACASRGTMEFSGINARADPSLG